MAAGHAQRSGTTRRHLVQDGHDFVVVLFRGRVARRAAEEDGRTRRGRTVAPVLIPSALCSAFPKDAPEAHLLALGSLNSLCDVDGAVPGAAGERVVVDDDADSHADGRHLAAEVGAAHARIDRDDLDVGQVTDELTNDKLEEELRVRVSSVPHGSCHDCRPAAPLLALDSKYRSPQTNRDLSS